MPSIIPHKGKFRVYIDLEGVRTSKIHATKKKALSWAAEIETKIRKEAQLKRTRGAVLDDSYTLGDLFKRYAEEVSPTKKGSRKEIVRLHFYLKSYKKLCSIKLIQLEREDIEEWVASRLEPNSAEIKPVKGSTVNRDLGLIGHCLTKARRWRLMSHKPFEDLERPKKPQHRKRLISDDEVKKMCAALNYKEDIILKQTQQRVALVWLFAIETCMRCSEITGLTQKTIDRVRGIAHLPDTKNGSPRDVPLSPNALALLDQLPTPPSNKIPIFQVTSASVDALFRKTRNQKTDIKDMHFHDSRHEGITRLVDSGEYNVFEVAGITGHKDIKELMTYYNKSATKIAKEMAEKSAAKTTGTQTDLTSIPDIPGLKDLVAQILKEQAKLTPPH